MVEESKWLYVFFKQLLFIAKIIIAFFQQTF